MVAFKVAKGSIFISVRATRNNLSMLFTWFLVTHSDNNHDQRK